MNKRRTVCTLALAALTTVAGCRERIDASRETAHDAGVTAKLGGDFTLTDQNGAQWTRSNIPARAAIIFFGYTHCADACPIAMSKIRRAAGLLGGDAKQLAAVFISVDPGRDTPEVLKQYASAFTFPLTALTGSKDEIDIVARKFGVNYSYQKSDSAAGYTVSHTTTLFLIDRTGRVRHLYQSGSTPDQIAEGVRHLLAE
jgi:protein SCO1/2